MADINLSNLFKIPSGATASRPSNPNVGDQYYNGTLGYLEIYTASGWIPATGANDFNLNISGPYTEITFSQSYSAGSYSIVSLIGDNTLDIYAFAADGSSAGYTNSKSFSATQRFNKMVILGGTSGDVLSFSYKTTFITSTSTTSTSAGPYITSITPSSMPNKNDTITITGGNFATDVAVAFTGTGYSSTAAKSIVRSSSTQLIVTRPDNFPPSGSPYTVTITNPSVANQPIGSNVHVYSGITAGVIPIWTTSSTLPIFSKNVAYSQSVVATDADGGSSITYSTVSGSLPTGITFNASTGTFSGTATTTLPTSYTVRATDSGGNYADRTFTLPNSGPVWTTSGAISNFVSNVSYSYQLVAVDDSGVAPTYTIASGSLPPGLSLSSSGLISGTTTYGSISTFTVTATDANGTSSTSSSLSISPAPTVTGGTLSSDSTYYYRTFTGNGTLSISGSTLSCDILSVAGGGGGGYRHGAGGGAGGLLYSSNQSLSINNYSIVIGGGGNGGISATAGGRTGINTTFSGGAISLTALGGGGGQSFDGAAENSANGGCGGGATTNGNAAGSGSQGGNGGTIIGDNSYPYTHAGGGGTGANGGDGNTSTGQTGSGGNGSNSYSSWISAISSSMVSGWQSATSSGRIGGGGGGGGHDPAGSYAGYRAPGGLGGGGQSGTRGTSSNGDSGITNTGGGGGGAATSNSGTGVGGNGGSGITIVRYTRSQVGG